MSKAIHIFGELAYFLEGHKEDEQRALNYLKEWKEFTMRKLVRDCYHAKLHDEQWGNRPSWVHGCLAQYAAHYLKISVEIEFDFKELHCLGSGVPKEFNEKKD